MAEAKGRRAAAEEAFLRYDFGLQQVKDTGGWQEVERDRWERLVYLEDEETPDGESERATFVVRFRPASAQVEESYANH